MVWNIFVGYVAAARATLATWYCSCWLTVLTSLVSVKIKNKNKPGNTTTVHYHGQL